MAVVMKRSTKIAPDSLSTSYLIGSAFIGISMTTLKASGASLPGDTLPSAMVRLCVVEKGRRDAEKPEVYFPCHGTVARKAAFACKLAPLANRAGVSGPRRLEEAT